MLTKDEMHLNLISLISFFHKETFQHVLAGEQEEGKKIQSVVEIFSVNNCVFVLCVGILPNGEW